MNSINEFQVLQDRRNQLKNIAIFSFAFLYLLISIFWFIIGYYPFSIIIFVSSFLIMMVGLISKEIKYLTLQTNLTLAICFLSLGYLLLMTYTNSLMVMIWLFLVPLGSLIFIDTKGIRFWTPILMVFVISVPFIGPYFPYKVDFPTKIKINIEFTQICIILIVEFIMLYIYRELLFNVLTSLQMKSNNLEKATRELEKNQAYKDQFFASVSHEIRTPMNAIKGIADLLKSSNEGNKELIGYLNNSTNHLLTIINDLLDFSKMQAGKLRLYNSHFNLRNNILSSCKIIKVFTQEKKQNFKINIANNLPFEVLGDPNRLTQIIVNVLNNASKYTPNEGEIIFNVIDLSKKNDRKNGRILIGFEVIDNGIGMNEETLKNVFKNYYRSESISSDTNITGSGLGLSITKYLVEAMNGTINIESKENVGTKICIKVSMPISKIEDYNHRNFENSLENIDLELNILIVEDNHLNLILIKIQLERIISKKSKIYSALNGKIAIDILKENKIDIILMDMKMPVLNGVEATKLIRNLPDPIKNSVPIIAMTAHVGEKEVKACFDCGMNAYISKPFEILSLVHKIHVLIAERENFY